MVLELVATYNDLAVESFRVGVFCRSRKFLSIALQHVHYFEEEKLNLDEDCDRNREVMNGSFNFDETKGSYNGASTSIRESFHSPPRKAFHFRSTNTNVISSSKNAVHHNQEKQSSAILDYSAHSFQDIKADTYQDIYNRMFRLLPESLHTIYTTEEAKAILLFNVALLYHRDGVECNGYDSENNHNHALPISLSIYMQSLEYLRSLEGAGCQLSDLMTLLLSALLHNIAHIYTMFHRADEARIMRSLLEKTLSRLQQSQLEYQIIQDQSSNTVASKERLLSTNILINKDDFVFFHMSLYFSRLNDFRLAPAA